MVLGINQTQGSRRHIHRKLRYWWKKSKMTQKDGEMLYYQKNQYVKMTILPQSIDSMQSLNYQTTFHRINFFFFTVCMEIEKTPNNQSNLGNEKWNLKNKASWLQTILQSYSDQDCMILAQKQKYRSIGQDRKPRETHTCVVT